MPDKRIWLYWDQGFEAAPPVVRLCLESWSRRNPGWTVLGLDRNSLPDHLDLAGIIDLSRRDLSLQTISDLVRLCLLRSQGGVWADATVFCARPLEDWLPRYCTTGFFAFRNPGPDRLIASWFLAAAPQNPLLQAFADAFVRFWQENSFSNQNNRIGRAALRILAPVFSSSPRRSLFWTSFVARKFLRVHPYFVVHYLFNRIVLLDAACRREWDMVPHLSAEVPHRLQFEHAPREHGLKQALEEIERGISPVHKLSWMIDSAHPYWKGVLQRLGAWD